MSQDKLKTMLMQNFFFGGGGGERTNKVHCGKCGSAVSKTTLALPPGKRVNARAFDFFENFHPSSPVCWQFRWSNAPTASASKSVISLNHHPRLFKNFLTCSTVYSIIIIIIIIITLFESQIILAEHECCTNWGDCKSNKSNQIKCWFLRRGENRSSRRKTSRSRVENQQTQPTYDAGSGNRTRDTLVEGERSHHYTNPAPEMYINTQLNATKIS